MDDEADPILQAVTALRAAGITVALVGDELERWQIGDLAFFDADLWGLAAIRRLVGDVDPRQLGAVTPTEPLASARGHQLEALRACLLYPQELRRSAYLSAKSVLRKRGFVEFRSAPGPGRREDAWFITAAGRAHLVEIDASKPCGGRAAGA